MDSSRKLKVIKNIIISFGVKFLTFAIGIIIPRLVIVGYGSEINGLLTTVTSIYTYLALIQAGVGIAATQALYKPLSEKNTQSISSILVATKRYYHRLTIWYAIGVFAFSTIYPFLVNTTISKWVIWAIIFINGISSILTYWYLSTVQALLSADGKEYIVQGIQFGVFILNSSIKIALILLGMNIIAIECAFLFINIFQILVYCIYIKRTYPWIDWKAVSNEDALNQRKHYLLNGVAWTVFNSTDTIIISTFCGLMLSSVYSMYNMVFANLNLLLTVLYNSVYFVLGQVYHEDKERYVKLHDGFESCISAVVFGCLSVAYILILPFLKIYTAGVVDINYIDAYLPLLFCAVHILSNCRMISGNLINLTNQPKLTNKASIIEVVVNLTLSVIFAKIIGIHGVLIATIVALLIKTNYIIVVSNKKILHRLPMRTYLTIGVNLGLFFLTMLFTKFVDLGISNYISFCIWGIVLVLIIVPLYLGINFLANPKSAIFVLRTFSKKLK